MSRRGVVDKSLALNPGVLNSITGSPSLLDDTVSHGPIFWHALKAEPLLVKPSGEPGHKTSLKNHTHLAQYWLQARNSHKHY